MSRRSQRLGKICRPRIVGAAPGDGVACHAVFVAAVHEGARDHYTAQERNAWAPGPIPDGWESRLLSQNTVVAKRCGKVIGFMTLGNDGFLDFAYVHPKWMGCGVADALYAEILHIAEKINCFELTTEASFLARQFLARKGWKTVARQSVIRHGVALTNFRMRYQCHLDDTVT